jgi:tRNA-splicing ligase RtcB (3'-phosphate/5'-hydroxy nucleic acid ligase)
METDSEQIKTFGPVDERSLEQLRRCLADVGTAGVLCADHHLGYSQPIGGGVAYPDHISPSGVGYDIACGNKAVRTPLKLEDVPIAATLDEIVDRISFGMGRSNKEPVADHPVLDAIRQAPFAPQRELYDLAAKQLGTVGAGNHYVDLFADEEDRVWIGVHFGSRGFGHKTASGFLSLAQGRAFESAPASDAMDAPPTLLSLDTELGQGYLEAMRLAGEYAYAGRDWVVDRVLRILGTEADYEVHNHHNFAWLEEHFGERVWVIRKGCTPAFPAQAGFVGASMGGDAVILEGVESPDAVEAMYSTVHGAGRVMSRTQAAGKLGSVYECTERDCGFHVTPRHYDEERRRREMALDERFSLCPDHPTGRMKKRRKRVKEGRVDFEAVQARLRTQGIELRGGAADEAPEVYKDLDEVLAAHEGTIRVLHRLRPVGVAMAGADTFDPFKD